MDNNNIPHANYQSKYLDDEYPILIRIPIARALDSDRQAYFLQQVKYWINTNKKKPGNKHYFNDGRWWMYNTLNEWCEQFPWLSKMTIRRIITALKEREILITGNYNKKKYDKTVWYSINERKLDELIEQNITECSKRTHGCGQKEHMDVVKVDTPIPETIQQISAEAKNPAAPVNNSKSKQVDKEYISLLKGKNLLPVINESKLIKQYSLSPLVELDPGQVVKMMKAWFKTADDKTVKEGYPFGYFFKDYNSIKKPPRVFAGTCSECSGQLYEDEDHVCSHMVFCDICNTGIKYSGPRRDEKVLNEHTCNKKDMML